MSTFFRERKDIVDSRPIRRDSPVSALKILSIIDSKRLYSIVFWSCLYYFILEILWISMENDCSSGFQ